MSFSKYLFAFAIAAMPVPASADVPLGLWEAAPDQRGVVVHVRTRPCGASICGQIERAKDTRGYDTPSRAVGRRMLLDMKVQPDGSYAGQIWEPDSNRLLGARMRVQGNRMQFDNCDGAVCKAVTWNRLR